MATLGLDEDELKTVEQLVSRLSQLSSSIQSFRMDVLKSNPLPPASSLQNSAQILQKNLQTCLENIKENRDLFDRMAIHPSTNFPGRTQEAVLTQILRKKLEPDAEELVYRGKEAAELASPDGIAALRDVWSELREWTHGRIAAYVRDEAGDVYTREEREAGVEGVRTGLKRDLESDDDDDDEDDEDEDEDTGGGDDEDAVMGGTEQQPPPPAAVQFPPARGPEPETLLWFATRGDFNVAPNVEYERKENPYRGLEGVRKPAIASGLVQAPGPEQQQQQRDGQGASFS